MEYLDKLIEKLTRATGIGYEGNVKEVIVHELKDLDIEAEIGQDGSVYALSSGSGNKNIMLVCHIDEIGFMVSYIEDNGFIRFSQVGGCDARILPGQEVTIIGKDSARGYIGLKPPHYISKEEKEKVTSLDQLFIDTGLPAAEVKSLIKIGDCISFINKYLKLHGDLRCAKSLDNRASVACGILILKEVTQIERNFNLHFVASSQEEYTGLGARIYSNKLPVDYAIVIDVTHGEHPEVSEDESYHLNGGPVIARGATIPERLFKMLVDTAKEIEIPHQIEPLPSWTGTDADTIAFSREGIPTCVLGIPLRYMHTPVEVVSLRDIERTARLIVNFLKKL